jgi:hypothetical protein
MPNIRVEAPTAAGLRDELFPGLPEHAQFSADQIPILRSCVPVKRYARPLSQQEVAEHELLIAGKCGS